MLQVENLKKSYGEEVLFDGVTFVVGTGERVGLVGRNGHGKTTLFRILLGEESADSGSVNVPRYYRIASLSQHISFSEPTVIREACSALPKTEDGRDESYKVEAILHGLGLTDEYFGVAPSELSGGYQVRLMLAKALASEPNLLLLDEPTNYLDIISLRWLRRFLCNWSNELIIITHDREFMDSVTTHTLGIHRKKARKIAGPTSKLYTQIRQDEEVYEQTRRNEEGKRKEIEKFIDRFRAKATKASAVQSRIKALEKKEKLEILDEIRNLDFAFNYSRNPSKFLLSVRGLSFGYDAAKPPLIDALDLTVGKRDRIAIVGKNGKGKSTLLGLLAGELKPGSGVIEKSDNLRLAYFGQTNIARLNAENTIEEELMAAHPDNNRGAARRICGAMLFEGDKALKKISVLSGGEKSRVMLGKLLLSPANLLLLDEPTNHLDMESVESLMDAVDEFQGTVIIVTHSEMVLERLAKRLVVFDRGRVSLFDGPYRDFLKKVGWSEEDAPSGSAAGDSAKAGESKRGMNRKELRRLRAEVMGERTRVLAPLKKKISTVEEKITAVEKTSGELSSELLDASGRQDSAAIAELSKSHGEALKEIDNLFEELATLTSRHDELAEEFASRLEELDRS